MATTFTTLQERSKEFSDMAPNSAGENATRMLQLIEDFCRVGDKLIEEEKQAKKDLQVQVSKIGNLFFNLFKDKDIYSCKDDLQ